MCHKTSAIFMKFHEARVYGILFVLLVVPGRELDKVTTYYVHIAAETSAKFSFKSQLRR